MSLYVSAHAIERAMERCGCATEDEARTLLSSPTIRKAAELGHCNVRLGTGQRVIIEGNTVITVHPRLRVKRRAYGRKEREE